MQKFGIIVTGHTRPLYLADVLLSLEKQKALKYTEVWLDGHQSISELKKKTEECFDVASKFSLKSIRKHNGTLGFRKMMLHVMAHAVKNYDAFVILEDDCFPTRNAVEIFRNELEAIRSNDEIFSVYGHHFLVPAEKETISRFQGWGWGTTSEKLRPFLEKLVACYSMPESDFLQFVNSALTADVVKRLDVTPPRNATDIVKSFYAWDETIALLTVLEKKLHKKTPERTIYNFGASPDSSRFKNIKTYISPPYNMVSHEEIWNYF